VIPVCDFLLVVHRNYMPMFYCFRDVTIYWSNICVFHQFYPSQSRLKPVLAVFIWGIGYASWYQENCRVPGLPSVKSTWSHGYWF